MSTLCILDKRCEEDALTRGRTAARCSISAARKPRAAAAAAKAEAADSLKSDAAPAVIVFGKDEAGKAHASCFGRPNGLQRVAGHLARRSR